VLTHLLNCPVILETQTGTRGSVEVARGSMVWHVGQSHAGCRVVWGAWLSQVVRPLGPNDRSMMHDPKL
jgi:hypothetical protein